MGNTTMGNTAAATAAGTIAAARNGGNDVRVSFRFHGGHHIMGLLGVDGPQSVGFLGRLPEIRVIILSKHDAELPGQALQVQVLEE